MLRNKESLMQICEVLAEQENLKATVREATKGALITGFGALVGGIIGGPIGLAIGGTISSFYAAYMGEDYRPVIDILKHDLTIEQKQILTEAIGKVVNDINPQDLASLIVVVMTSASLKELVLKELGTFLLNEMGMKVIR